MCDRQRAVLGQVQVLAGHRRHDHPQRLRQHDPPQHGAAAQTERAGRLPLAERHRLDAGPHDLGDIRGGIEHQAEQQGEELRADRAAALEVEAVQHRHFEPRSARRAHPTPPAAGQSAAASATGQTAGRRPVASWRRRRMAAPQPMCRPQPPRKATSAQVSAAFPDQLRQPDAAIAQEDRGCRCAAPGAVLAGSPATRTRTATAAAAECRAASRHRRR